MADPLSVTAGVLATISFAGHSCQLLFDCFRTISDAPQEVQRQIAALRALRSTFGKIEALGKHCAQDVRFTSEFLIRLDECMADLRATEMKVHKVDEQLKRGRMRRTWARLKWSSTADHWLSKFFTRVQTYYTTFTLELLTLQIRLNLPGSAPDFQTDQQPLPWQSPLEEHVVAPAPVSSYTGPLVHHTARVDAKEMGQAEAFPLRDEDGRSASINSDGSDSWAPIEPSIDDLQYQDSTTWVSTNLFTWFLEAYMGPVSVRVPKLYRYDTLLGTMALWLGPIVVQRWTQNQKPFYEVSPPSKGYGAGMTLRLPWWYFGKLGLMIFLTRSGPHCRGCSLQWNLSFSRVVPRDADIMRYVRAGDLLRTREMFQAGSAAPSDTSPEGITLLHIAARNNSVEMIKLLVQEGADVNAMDEDGETPLHMAIARGQNYDASRLLIESGADIENRSIDGRTPLHTFFNEVVAKVLLRHGEGVDLATCDNQGMTLFHFLVWSSKSVPGHLQPYIEEGNSHYMVKDKIGRSVLHFAAQRGNIAILDYLFELQPNLSLRCQDCYGRSLLHYAVESRRIEVIERMITRGADIRASDKRGRTVLHHAVMRGNLAAVKRVIELGGGHDLWSTDSDRMTPIHLAYLHGGSAVSDYLSTLQSISFGHEKASGGFIAPHVGSEGVYNGLSGEQRSLQGGLRSLGGDSNGLWLVMQYGLITLSILCLLTLAILWRSFVTERILYIL